MKKYWNRLLAMLLAVLMVFTTMPVAAMGAESPEPATEADGGLHVVINQAYGGGGNSGAEYKNDFIELYNPTDSSVDLDGWSIQYASAEKSFNSNNLAKLKGVINPHSFFLIQGAAQGEGTIDLPEPDFKISTNLSGSAFKLALVRGTELITNKSDSNVVDFLGVGNADNYEGSGAAPTASNTSAVCRKADGVDTNDNADDFILADPNPRNSSSTGTSTVPTQVATPKAEPASGATVAPGTVVTLSCSTADAGIQYAVITGDLPGDWVADTKITLPDVPGTYKYKVKAGPTETLLESDILELTYTVQSSSAIPDPSESVTWAKLSGIEEAVGLESVAITMTKGEQTWILPSSATNSNPKAIEVKTDGSTLITTGTSDGFAWSITSIDGGYHIQSGGNYLNLANSGTGVQINSTPRVWALSLDHNYLVSEASAYRYLGVYLDNPEKAEWRSYIESNITKYISNQEVVFWKLDSSSTPTPPPAPTKVATPTAIPASGATVNPGATIEIACDTVGATIKYIQVIDGQDEQEDTWLDLGGNAIILPEEAGTYHYNLKVPQ